MAKEPTYSCILCGGATEALRRFPRSVTSEAKMVPAASVLLVCAACGHLQTAVDLDLGSYYADSYDSTLSDDGADEIVSTLDGRVLFRTDLDFDLMKRHLGNALAGSPSIFEFGCGRGRILSRLHKEGHRHLTAYDVSELYREVMAQFVDAESIFIRRRPSATFDVVLSFFVLEHDVDPVGSLLYLRDRMATNGILYLMVPNYVSNSVDLACADHLSHFSPGMLSTLVQACGLRVITVDDTSSIGAVVVVAATRERALPREEVQVVDPERIACARGSAYGFLNYMSRLESLTSRLKSNSVAIYGAGFQGTLVQARLETAEVRVTNVFDANPRKQGTFRLGLTVQSPDVLSRGDWSNTELVMCINPKIAADVGQKLAPYVRAVHIV